MSINRVALERRLKWLVKGRNSPVACYNRLSRLADIQMADYLMGNTTLLEELSQTAGIPRDELDVMTYMDLARRLEDEYRQQGWTKRVSDVAQILSLPYFYARKHRGKVGER